MCHKSCWGGRHSEKPLNHLDNSKNFFQAFIIGQHLDGGDVVKLLRRQSIAGLLTGLAFALSLTASHCFMRADGLSHMALSIATMLAAENILNILIFGIMGIVIAGKIIDSHGPYALVVKDYGTAVALWALLLMVQMVNIMLFWPICWFVSIPFGWVEAIITAWSGLRGYVGLTLALYILSNPAVMDEVHRSQAFFYVAAVVVLTVIVQGCTFELFLTERFALPHRSDYCSAGYLD
ncbi:hypothetical protein WJX84_000685 [Apatococcus fuscideae]|uniref:Uncharacterized protein n=1 Tax=Apatococcus fuscideae TaxID=2026836 RepID=A0AAW1TI38_9CHLO